MNIISWENGRHLPLQFWENLFWVKSCKNHKNIKGPISATVAVVVGWHLALPFGYI